MGAFVREAAAPLFVRAILAPFIGFVLLLTLTNLVVLSNIPADGSMPSASFIAASVVRLLGLIWFSVAFLRIINRSPRPAWLPDGSLFTYAITLVLGIMLVAAGEIVAGGGRDAIPSLIASIIVAIVTAPFAPWFTALAVERPLAWRPQPWFRRFGDWLAPLLLATLLFIVPLGELHGMLSHRLVTGAGDWFWPILIADGPLSAAMAVMGLALGSAAYRRVAGG